MEAVRVVETAYKLVKKNDEEIEVADGLKGRIIPFELVQQEKFQAELDAIAQKQARLEQIASELEELRESFTEEETETYIEDEKLLKPAVKADVKPKADVDPETKAKLKQFVALWDEDSKVKKQIVADRQSLTDKTVEAIEQLSSEDIELFLHKKWIEPVCAGICATLTAEMATLEKAVKHLAEKYATSYKAINDNIASAQDDLLALVGQLTGDDNTIRAMQDLIGGDASKCH